ncbi:hypothetical protein ABH941_006797 [Streptacidiphilus sp. EB103A]
MHRPVLQQGQQRCADVAAPGPAAMTAAAPTGASAPEGTEAGSERSRAEAGPSGGRAEPAERLPELGARTAPPVTVFSAPAPAGSAFGLRAFEWNS